jgi:outer membrane immunogenic protein
MFGSLRGRIGYAVDRTLFFGTAGVAWANISQNIQKGRNAGEQVVWEDQTATGYVVGGGIEYAFDNSWVGRAEYLYSNYGNVTLYNADGNRAEFKNDMSLLRVGLSHKF